MSYTTITHCFWLALAVGLPMGVTMMVMWIRTIFPALLRSLGGEKRIELDSVAMKALFYGFPGLLAMIICAVPAFYFGHLRKQFDYCVEVVRVNPAIGKEHEDLKERCGEYDVEELFREAGR